MNRNPCPDNFTKFGSPYTVNNKTGQDHQFQKLISILIFYYHTYGCSYRMGNDFIRDAKINYHSGDTLLWCRYFYLSIYGIPCL